MSPSPGATDKKTKSPVEAVTEALRVASGPTSKLQTKVLVALAEMDATAPVLLRKDRELNLSRSGNLEAILGQRAGTVSAPECRQCKGGSGPFKECKVVTDHFKGSCANCHYGSESARCTFRPPEIRSGYVASKKRSDSVTLEPESPAKQPVSSKDIRTAAAIRAAIRALSDVADTLDPTD